MFFSWNFIIWFVNPSSTISGKIFIFTFGIIWENRLSNYVAAMIAILFERKNINTFYAHAFTSKRWNTSYAHMSQFPFYFRCSYWNIRWIATHVQYLQTTKTYLLSTQGLNKGRIRMSDNLNPFFVIPRVNISKSRRIVKDILHCFPRYLCSESRISKMLSFFLLK